MAVRLGIVLQEGFVLQAVGWEEGSVSRYKFCIVTKAARMA